MVCDSAKRELVFEFDSKTTYPVIFGRSKEGTQSNNFIYLNHYTNAKSISHRHAYISYDKENDEFIFNNEGRNGGTVDSSLILHNTVVLQNNSKIEMGGFKMIFLVNK